LRWRRLYPVPFRVLNDAQKFGRWNWIKYQFTSPKDDTRRESQKVVPESIDVLGKLKASERSRIGAGLCRESVEEAEAKGETLTLIRPSRVALSWRRKNADEIERERAKHAALANQLSLLDEPTKPLEPCPFAFSFDWVDPNGRPHTHSCDDWETSTAFFRRRAASDETSALASLQETYEHDFPKRGMAFALGTHSRRKSQWLLVGVLRVDDTLQTELF